MWPLRAVARPTGRNGTNPKHPGRRSHGDGLRHGLTPPSCGRWDCTPPSACWSGSWTDPKTKGRGVVPRPGREQAVRAMKVVRGEAPPQDDASDTLHRFTDAKRAVILEEIRA